MILGMRLELVHTLCTQYLFHWELKMKKNPTYTCSLNIEDSQAHRNISPLAWLNQTQQDDTYIVFTLIKSIIYYSSIFFYSMQSF